MPNVVNPKAAVLIKGASDWYSDDEPRQLDIELEITKDLDGEPNEATVRIYNLTADTRTRVIDPSVRDTPIEIAFAPWGSSDLVTCFVGEITTAVSTPERPGYVTELTCQSQRWQSRSKYIDEKTYDGGTPIQTVVDELVAIIDLPSKISAMPSGSLALATSVSGPAFLVLQKLVWDYGYFVYIMDGVLYVSGVYSPPEPSLINITKAMQVTAPQPRERTDAVDVVFHTITDTNAIDPFAKQSRRKKRKIKKQVITRSTRAISDRNKVRALQTKQELDSQKPTQNGYVTVDAIDDVIFGVECETLGTPAVNPDSIVTFEGDDNQYRIQVVTHRGDTRRGFSTIIEADLYEGDPVFGGLLGTDRSDAAWLKQTLRDI